MTQWGLVTAIKGERLNPERCVNQMVERILSRFNRHSHSENAHDQDHTQGNIGPTVEINFLLHSTSSFLEL